MNVFIAHKGTHFWFFIYGNAGRVVGSFVKISNATEIAVRTLMCDRVVLLGGRTDKRTFGGSHRWDGRWQQHHLWTQACREMCPWLHFIGSALGSAMWAVGDFGAKSREGEEKCNGNRHIKYFYSLAVEAGFYDDVWRLAGSFTTLSNVDRGRLSQ